MPFCTVLLKQRSKHTVYYTKVDKHMADLKHTLHKSDKLQQHSIKGIH